MAGRLFFACRLAVLRSVRLISPCRLSVCGAAARRLARLGAIALGVVPPCPSVVLGFSGIVLASSRRRAVASGRLIVSSSHRLIVFRPVLSIRRAGSVERSVPMLAAC